ncbi:hypothetical protein HDU96_009652 [Phlyctochytrium bullatum]|nr:hypothetical protein HDU96_009652 [Phlyctochytrium bullatum]
MNIPQPPIDQVIPSHSDGQETIGHPYTLAYPFSDTEDSADDLRSPFTSQGLGEGGADVQTSQDLNESDEDIDINHPAEGLNTLKVEKVLLNGYLMKKGEKRKTWKKRWFVLRATILAYYKNEKEYELLKIIPLAEVHTIAEVRDLKKRKNVFGVVTRQRTYYIMCETKEQMDDWLTKLKEAHREVHRLIKKEMSQTPSHRSSTVLTPLSMAGSPGRPGPASAFGTTSAFSSQNQLNGANASSNPASPRLEPRVRFLDSDVVVGGSTSQRGSNTLLSGPLPSPAVNLPLLDVGLARDEVSTTSETSNTAADTSDAQSQVSNLSSAFTMESMLTVLSTPSMIQTAPLLPSPVTAQPPPAALELPRPPATLAAPSPTAPTYLSSVSGGSTSSDPIEDRSSSAHRPSQGSINSRPITGILVNRNQPAASSPLAQSASSSRPGGRRENVLSSSDEDEEGGNESDGTINDNKVICEGYLFKQGTKYKQSWKKRWFVLRNGKLTCYKNNGEYVVKRMVQLRNVLDIHEIDSQASKHQFCFKVVLSKRTMVLSASSEEERHRWVTSMKSLHKVVMRRAVDDDVEP